jgi:hypothetical protein
MGATGAAGDTPVEIPAAEGFPVGPCVNCALRSAENNHKDGIEMKAKVRVLLNSVPIGRKINATFPSVNPRGMVTTAHRLLPLPKLSSYLERFDAAVADLKVP